MCGRFDQSQTARYYANLLGWADALFDSQATPAFNVAPGTYRPLLHIADGVSRVDDLLWSYRARWAKGKVPIAINARLEKLDNRYWRSLLGSRRALVPAQGWYEWTGEKGHKQPWHIHRADGEPLFMLALANFGSFKEDREEAGFVLVTDDASGGMLDIHDRRPVIVDASDAASWLAPDLAPEQALANARARQLPVDAFAWHAVSQRLNRVGNDGPELTQPVELAAPPGKAAPA